MHNSHGVVTKHVVYTYKVTSVASICTHHEVFCNKHIVCMLVKSIMVEYV